jgi:hypothetical protein
MAAPQLLVVLHAPRRPNRHLLPPPDLGLSVAPGGTVPATAAGAKRKRMGTHIVPRDQWLSLSVRWPVRHRPRRSNWLRGPLPMIVDEALPTRWPRRPALIRRNCARGGRYDLSPAQVRSSSSTRDTFLLFCLNLFTAYLFDSAQFSFRLRHCVVVESSV